MITVSGRVENNIKWKVNERKWRKISSRIPYPFQHAIFVSLFWRPHINSRYFAWFGNSNSSIHDQITAIMLQKLHPNAVTHLTSLLNRIFADSISPSIWKLAIVIAIPRPLKDPIRSWVIPPQQYDPESYRLIALLSTLSKIYERISNRRFMRNLEANNLLNEDQYGCHRGSSTMTLAELDAHIHSVITRTAAVIQSFSSWRMYIFPGGWRQLILTTFYKYSLRSQLLLLL